MILHYNTLSTRETAEIIEKKSRFIATVRPVTSEEEAVAFINEMKKKYWDARHNCSAFVIGDHMEISRCSDDGERRAEVLHLGILCLFQGFRSLYLR